MFLGNLARGFLFKASEEISKRDIEPIGDFYKLVHGKVLPTAFDLIQMGSIHINHLRKTSLADIPLGAQPTHVGTYHLANKYVCCSSFHALNRID